MTHATVVLAIPPVLAEAIDKAADAYRLSREAFILRRLSETLHVPLAPAQPLRRDDDAAPLNHRATRIAEQAKALSRIGRIINSTNPKTTDSNV